MKKNHITILTVGIIFIFFVNLQCTTSNGKTLTVVDKPLTFIHYEKIQDAINNASDGDTIEVWDDTYNESIVINKSIFLIGINKEKTMIKTKLFNTISITADNVLISGFTILREENQEFGSCIALFNTSNVTITNNTFQNSKGACISINQQSHDNIINENTLTNTQYGIYITESNNNIITENNIETNYNGITILDNCQNNTIHYNNLTNNSYGVYIGEWENTLNNEFYHNNFMNNSNHAQDLSQNKWYNETLSHGNYWDDYNGTDNNNDAIGDTSYNLDGEANEDLYPLMSTYQGRIVLEEYNVDQELIFIMLIIGMIITIGFIGPIAYLWYRKKKKMGYY